MKKGVTLMKPQSPIHPLRSLIPLAALAAVGCTRSAGAAGSAITLNPPPDTAPVTVSSTTSSVPASPTFPAVAGDPNVYVGLAQRVIPSVVNISTLTFVKGFQGGGRPEDLFRQYFFGGGGDDEGGVFQSGPSSGGRRRSPGLNRGPHGNIQIPRSAALGTGFVIDPNGIILTNNHVVAEADEIKISFTEDHSEKPVEGKVIGRDTELDIALIRVKTDRKLTALPLGDSDRLQIGEYVAAVGNPFGQGHSISHGIVSQKGRPAPEFPLATYIQTDAPINPGNSGGPLLNLKGEVIGINDAIDPRAHGIGFAIPINLVKRELEQLQSKGTIARGYLGVLVGELNPELAEKIGAGRDTEAPVVTQVYPDSPAREAGLKPYDVVLAINGTPVHTATAMTAAVASLPAGDKVSIKISRDGREKSIAVTLGRRPQPQEVSRADFGQDPTRD